MDFQYFRSGSPCKSEFLPLPPPPTPLFRRRRRPSSPPSKRNSDPAAPLPGPGPGLRRAAALSPQRPVGQGACRPLTAARLPAARRRSAPDMSRARPASSTLPPEETGREQRRPRAVPTRPEGAEKRFRLAQRRNGGALRPVRRCCAAETRLRALPGSTGVHGFHCCKPSVTHICYPTHRVESSQICNLGLLLHEYSLVSL